MASPGPMRPLSPGFSSFRDGYHPPAPVAVSLHKPKVAIALYDGANDSFRVQLSPRPPSATSPRSPAAKGPSPNAFHRRPNSASASSPSRSYIRQQPSANVHHTHSVSPPHNPNSPFHPSPAGKTPRSDTTPTPPTVSGHGVRPGGTLSSKRPVSASGALRPPPKNDFLPSKKKTRRPSSAQPSSGGLSVRSQQSKKGRVITRGRKTPLANRDFQPMQARIHGEKYTTGDPSAMKTTASKLHCPSAGGFSPFTMSQRYPGSALTARVVEMSNTAVQHNSIDLDDRDVTDVQAKLSTSLMPPRQVIRRHRGGGGGGGASTGDMSGLETHTQMDHGHILPDAVHSTITHLINYANETAENEPRRRDSSSSARGNRVRGNSIADGRERADSQASQSMNMSGVLGALTESQITSGNEMERRGSESGAESDATPRRASLRSTSQKLIRMQRAVKPFAPQNVVVEEDLDKEKMKNRFPHLQSLLPAATSEHIIGKVLQSQIPPEDNEPPLIDKLRSHVLGERANQPRRRSVNVAGLSDVAMASIDALAKSRGGGGVVDDDVSDTTSVSSLQSGSTMSTSMRQRHRSPSVRRGGGGGVFIPPGRRGSVMSTTSNSSDPLNLTAEDRLHMGLPSIPSKLKKSPKPKASSKKPLWKKVFRLVKMTQSAFPRKYNENDADRKMLDEYISKGLVIDHFDSEHVPEYYQQVNKQYYTNYALGVRRSNKRNDEFKMWMKKFWNLMPKDPTGAIRKNDYIHLNRRFYKVLIRTFDSEDADANALEDWEHDRNGRDTMDFYDFTDSLFDLVDVWCVNLNVDQYIKWIKRLYEKVTTSRPHLRWRNEGEIDYDGWLAGDDEWWSSDDEDGLDMSGSFPTPPNNGRPGQESSGIAQQLHPDMTSLEVLDLAEKILRQWDADFARIRSDLDQPESLSGIRRLFLMLDLNNDGFIDITELRTVLKGMKLYPSNARLKEMFSTVDRNGDGYIDFDEFVYMRRRREPTEVNVVVEFKKFDVDPLFKGYLTPDGVKRVYLAEGLQGDSLEYAVEMVMSSDTDCDGKVSFKDLFEKMVERVNDEWMEWVYDNLSNSVSDGMILHCLQRFGGYRYDVARTALECVRESGLALNVRDYPDMSHMHVPLYRA